MQKVTLWYKILKDKEGNVTGTSFNHLEDGWSSKEFPAPKLETFTNQVAWEKEEWHREYKYMNEKLVVVSDEAL